MKGACKSSMAVVFFLFSCSLCLGQSGAQQGFERLKTLVGDWEGENAEGKPVRVFYELVAAGSALVEHLDTPESGKMVTVYHLDGVNLMMTHYCSAQNQPRMRAMTSDSNLLDFIYVGATNLKSENDGHMNELKLRFKDADHITAEWVWKQAGAEKADLMTFRRRKKP